MTYPPRPQNISIPAVVAGNILQNDDTSISAIDSGYDGAIVMKTENKLAMLIDPQQRVSIDTEQRNAKLTINSDLQSIQTLRLSYQDLLHFDAKILSNGTAYFEPKCDDPSLISTLTSGFKQNVDIIDHNGSNTGLKLGGMLVTATASELNYVDVVAGVGTANRALVLNNSRNITNINQLSASQITGTLMTANQPNITTLHTVNIANQLSIRGEVFDIDLGTIRLLNVSSRGVAFASKTMILDENKNFTGLNNFSANNISGTLTAGAQPNISSLIGLQRLINNGPTSLNGSVEMMKPDGNHLRLMVSSTAFATLESNSLGELVLKSSSQRVRVADSLVLTDHNGTNKGLILGSGLVRASADQLNYNVVTAGVAQGGRSLVLNSDRDISGINSLSAGFVFGTLMTGTQPNINSVSTLNITGHNGLNVGLSLNGILVTATATELNYVDTPIGRANPSKALVVDADKSIQDINSLSATTLSGVLLTENQPNIRQVNTLTISGNFRLGSTLITATGEQINRLNVTSGVVVGDRALVVDGARNIVGINNLTSTTIAGTLTTSDQPNIASVNTFNIVQHDGSTKGLSLNGILVSSTAAQLNRVNVGAGVAEPNKALVLNGSMNISGINTLGANTLSGTLSTATQPFIRTVKELNIEDHDGSKGLQLNGILITSTANQLNYVSVGQGIAAPSKALVLDSGLNISGINSLRAVELGGTLLTSNQPNISRVLTLNIVDHNAINKGLSLGGVLVTASANQINTLSVVEGTAGASKALVVDSSRNISGINIMNATTLIGTLQTAHQPNIASVNTLNIINHNGTTGGLMLQGNLVTVAAEQINRLNTQLGIASNGRVMVLDNNRNITNINSLSASQLSGVIQTPSQPLIDTVNTLNISQHNGNSTGLRLNGVLVEATAEQLNFSKVTAGMATAMKSMVTNEFNSITGINSLSATRVVAQEVQLSGVVANFNVGALAIKSYSFTDLVGRMVDIRLLTSLNFTNFAPNDISSGYSCEIIGYINPRFSETYTFFVNCNDRVRLWINGKLLIHSWIKTGTLRTSSPMFLNADQWVPIYIQYQLDTGSPSFFTLEWSSSSTTRAVIPNARLAWDNNTPSVSSNHFSQNSLTIYNTSTPSANTTTFEVDTSGDLLIDASGNDIILGSGDSLNIPSHDGVSKGLYLAGVLVKPTAYELNYLKVSPGTVNASQALVVDASKSLSGINSLGVTSISCENLSTNAFTINNLSLTGPLNNYNFGAVLIRQFQGSNCSGRMVHVNTINSINLSNYDPRELNNNFSFDIIGSILPQFTENYRFHVIVNDRARVWVNENLILNIWDTSAGTEFTSDPVPLIANQWVSIYIQYENISGSSSLQLRWSSSSLTKSFISSSFMAWDNTIARPPREIHAANSLTLYSSSQSLLTPQTSTISVDNSGTMTLSSRSGTINIAAGTNFNILGHNGSTTGFRLAGQIIAASAAELNYLAGSIPGTAIANKAFVMDTNRAISGITSITSNEIFGQIRTPLQPFITSFGTLSSTLNTSSDILINNTNLFRVSADSTACYLQAGSSTTANSSADVFIGNYNSTITTSSRKFMIKTNGFVGIQNANPSRALSINGEGAAFAMRIGFNSSESAFCDIGVDSSSNLRITSNLIIGNTGTSTLSVNSAGKMHISPSGGSLQIGNAINSVIPLEVGSGSFTLSSSVGYLNSFGSSGVTIPTATTYSLRTDSSIIVNGTVCITSDRRLKNKIKCIEAGRCREFIMNSKPVEFSYINDPNEATHFGLIAQDILKSEFNDLVKISPHSGVKEEIDSDGNVLPEGVALNVSYDEVIPIMMTTMKEVISENEILKKQVNVLMEQVRSLTEKINSL